MSGVAQEWTERAQREPHAIEVLLAEREFPIVEGSRVTFVYRGPADSVHLRHWIYGLGSSLPYERVEGTDLWTLTMDLPAGSRVEYKIEVVHGGDRRLVQDPFNPHLARDPYGANSVVQGEGYVEPAWAQPDPEARTGEVLERRFRSEVFGDVRSLSIYLPARFRRTRRYPLLFVHDGTDYLRFTGLQAVLDNLIHRLELPPLIAVLVQSNDRLTEYSDDPRNADYLVEELLPLMEDEYPTYGTPAGRCLMGASFGAVASLAAAWRHPGVFGNLFLQSGSFAFTDIGEHDRGPLFDPVVEFVNQFRDAPGKPAERVYMSCGTYESLIYYNRSMQPLLSSTGMDVRYSESRDGHNWENWRDRLREGLTWVFPGPLWMVYE
ncbi:MAG: enterochelin esterase [bacterium]|nr:enterochelin esterase [bacterium]